MTIRRPNFDSYYDTPNLDDLSCDVCGKFPDDCICPECHYCGAQGDPRCYIENSQCGLIRTPEQGASFAEFCKARDEEIAAENAYYDSLAEAEDEANSYYESIINPDRL